MIGPGYSNAASGFSSNAGYSTSGGSDLAAFSDSQGHAMYYAYADSNNRGQPLAGMMGSYAGFGEYSNAASGFATNVGYSTSGGSDTAAFYDSQGHATFYAYADYTIAASPWPA